MESSKLSKLYFVLKGYMQHKEICFFETYALVFQWTTVRLMIIIEVLLQLNSNQVDITAAFLHGKLEEDYKLFFNMPKVFEQYDKRGKLRVLILKKTIYGLCQSPRYFWKYLTKELIPHGYNL